MRRWIIMLGLLAVLLVGLGSVAPLASAQGDVNAQAAPSVVTYVVKPGDTIYGIARMYHVDPAAIIAANHLPNPSWIYPGQVLVIPAGNLPPGPCQQTYVVQRGDTLSAIGRRFGVSWQSIAAANHLFYPYTIYPGQRLVIPCTTPPPPQQRIVITSPAPYAVVTSPVTVKGQGQASFEQTLGIRIYDQNNHLVGQGSALVQGELGQPGPFSGTVTFNIPRGQQRGRIEVVDVSAKDGSVLYRATQQVWLRRP